MESLDTVSEKIPKTGPVRPSPNYGLEASVPKCLLFCDRSSHGVESYFVADRAEIFFIRQTLISGAVLLP